ncbi:hypothetical protein EON65_37120 [archaeon]|nr:MAG: hypothetical protein EON65_37120 [archaeon]
MFSCISSPSKALRTSVSSFNTHPNQMQHGAHNAEHSPPSPSVDDPSSLSEKELLDRVCMQTIN